MFNTLRSGCPLNVQLKVKIDENKINLYYTCMYPNADIYLITLLNFL